MKRKLTSLRKLDFEIGKINIYIYEGGLAVTDVLALAKLVSDIKGKDLLIAEVGSWTGCSTFVLANEVKDRGGKVFAIDHWKGNEGTILETFAQKENVYSVFKKNMIAMGVWDTIHPMRMTSQKAVKKFKDESLDLVFLDADHRYKYIKQDILSWLPKVKVGGILCGHDAEVKYSECTDSEKKYIDEYLNTDCIKGIEPYIHGGVIKALYDCFADKHIIMPYRIWYYKRGK